MGTAFVILLLLALCGFIAYVGDLLGRRLGKKRLSIFGLRPKHTAILLTIVTGVLIAGVTFAAAMASVPEFRRVVTQSERLVGRNRALARQIIEGKQRNEQLQAANTHLGTSNLQLQGENQQLQGKNQQLGGANKKLEITSRTLKEQSGALRRRNADLQATNTRLRGANEGLQGTNASLRGANSRLTGATQRLQREQVRLGREVADLRPSSGSYREQAEAYREEAKTFREQAKTFRRVVNDYKNDDYLFRRDEEIVRKLVPPNAPVEKLHDAVDNLLFLAERRASERLPDKPHVIQLEPPQSYVGPRPPNIEEIRKWVVRQMLTANSQPVAIRLIATENSVAGRPIPVKLAWYPNVQVYAKDDVIAERVVDGGGDELMELVFEDLLLFLRQEVRDASIKHPRSMVPDHEGVGKISYGQLLQAWLRIRQINGRVVVRALAANDTLRSGPLNVKLEVTPVESAAGFSR